MDRAPLSDLDSLDRDALLALFIAQQEKLDSLIADRDAEVRRLEAELDSHRQTLSEQVDELRSRSERIEHLKLMVDKLRHVIFGTKSEKIVIKLEQMELELEDDETTHAELESGAERVSPAKEPKARPERKPLQEHLSREVVTHTPSGDCCADCGGQLHQFGEDVSEQLEYVPDSFKVVRHVRPKFTCTGCDRVVEAPAPSRPIERGLAGPGLLAHVIVSKFSDHLLLYRQSEIYARQGVEISRSTLAGWVGAASDLLGPLVDAIQKHVLAGRKLHADDTPMPRIAPCVRCLMKIRHGRTPNCDRRKNLNNLLEQDNRGIKFRTRPMFGFKNYDCAAITLAGIELLRRIGKNQFALRRLHIKDQTVPAIWNAVLAA
jgi:transposase